MDKDKVTLELDFETASALSVILTSALAKYHRKHKNADPGNFYRDTWRDVTDVRDTLRQQIRRAFQEGSAAL